MTNWLLVSFLFAVLSRAEADGRGEQGVIGSNSVMCITFDRLNWNGDFEPSKGIYMNNYSVRRKLRCGLDGGCGLFESPSKLKIPFYWDNLMWDAAFSIWFMRSKRRRDHASAIFNKGECGSTPLEMESLDDTHFRVNLYDSSGLAYSRKFRTVSQSDGWHHVVVSVHIDVVTRLGMAKVYFDGRRVGKTVVDLTEQEPSVGGPMQMGASPCSEDGFKYFDGLLDSLSYARYDLSDKEVRQLYKSRGACIGE